MLTLEYEGLQTLLRILKSRGYRLLGPTVRDGAIVVDTITGIDDLPAGWADVQGSATYGLRRRDDDALFGYAIGPVSWKKFLLPPRVRLFSARRSGKGFEILDGQQSMDRERAPMAFIGIRSCELQALAHHDRIFMDGEHSDPTYKEIRESTFLLAVDCLEPGGNCFCGSMGTGPEAREGFDIALTELGEPGRPKVLMRSGSRRGEEILGELGGEETSLEEANHRVRHLEESARRMGRVLETEHLPGELVAAFEHPEWDEISKRCLSCANCTMVCPTCFCSTVEDSTDLSGETTERWRRWDSCYTADFARVAGGNIRPSPRARYRQWLMHKFAYWTEQFGTFGCVGCGRCITWCPAGIDITVEVETLRKAPVQNSRLST